MNVNDVIYVIVKFEIDLTNNGSNDPIEFLDEYETFYDRIPYIDDLTHNGMHISDAKKLLEFGYVKDINGDTIVMIKARKNYRCE